MCSPRITSLAQLHARCIPVESGCILYPPTKHPYGLVVTERGRRTAARAAWELASGFEMPRELYPCHQCDTPRCTNPAHISAGTHADNMREKAQRGRSNNAGKRHLSWQAVADVRQMRAAGATYVAIAQQYGVHPNCIGQICRNVRHSTTPALT